MKMISQHKTNLACFCGRFNQKLINTFGDDGSSVIGVKYHILFLKKRCTGRKIIGPAPKRGLETRHSKAFFL